MSYRRSRQPNGRFRKATLENTFGLTATVCEKCRQVNTAEVGQPAPTICIGCGQSLAVLAKRIAEKWLNYAPDVDSSDMTALLAAAEDALASDDKASEERS